MIDQVRTLVGLLLITVSVRAAPSTLIADFRARLEAPSARVVAANAAQVVTESSWEITRQVWAAYDSITVDRIDLLSAMDTADTSVLRLRVIGQGRTFAGRVYELPREWTVTYRRADSGWRFADADFGGGAILVALQRGDLDADAIDATPLSAAIITRYARMTPLPRNLAAAAAVAGALAERAGDDTMRVLAMHVKVQAARAAEKLNEAGDVACAALDAAQNTGDPDLIASTLVVAAHIDRIRGFDAFALARFRAAAAMTNAIRDRTIAVNAMLAAGTLLRVAARYSEAFAEEKKALEIAEGVGFSEGADLARFNIGFVHSDLRQHVLALTYIDQALGGLRREHRPYNFGVVAALAFVELLMTGNRNGAVTLAREALAMPGTPQSLHPDITIAEIERFRGHLAPLSEYEKILDQATMADSPWVRNGRLHWLVGIAISSGDPARALEFAQREIPLRSDSIDSSVETDLGTAYACSGDFDAAESHLRTAIGAIEAERRSFPGDDAARSAFFENISDAYRELIQLLVETGHEMEAWNWLQRIKGRVLLDAASRASVKFPAFTAEDEAERRTRLEALAAANRELLSADSRKGAELARARVERAQKDLDRFRTEFFLRHVTAPAGTQAALDDGNQVVPPRGSLLLDYLLLDDETLLFKVYNDGGRAVVHASHIALSGLDARAAADDLRSAIEKGDLAYAAHRRKLDKLITAAEPELHRAKRLYIVPDNALWNVPFGLLHDSKGVDLVESHAIALLPAARMLATPRRPQSYASTLLSVGNPSLSSSTISAVRSLSSGAALGALPDSETEARTVARLYGEKNALLLVGGGATEAAVKQSCGNARILHFATHGFVDEQNSMYSGLVLARDADGSDDGILDARELTQLSLHADLAVLSACDTARGLPQIGEGLIGLSWAFAIAGCPTTVVSQWQAQSKATAELMIDFHRRLLAGDDAATALRRAELALRRKPEYRHPLYWAPFVVIGN
jgi:CHAT domain-containing protein